MRQQSGPHTPCAALRLKTACLIPRSRQSRSEAKTAEGKSQPVAKGKLA